MVSQAEVARWYEGEDVFALAPLPTLPRLATSQEPSPPPQLPPGLLNAKALADRFSIAERTARRTIERGVMRGLPGFYRDGCHLLAEADAFERLRAGVSELCPNVGKAA